MIQNTHWRHKYSYRRFHSTHQMNTFSTVVTTKAIDFEDKK